MEKSIVATLSLLSLLFLFSCEKGDEKQSSVKDISFKQSIVSLIVGNTQQLEVIIVPADSDVIDKIVYISADTSIAIVDKTGLLTAIAYGKTKITAAVGDKSVTCEVNVTLKGEPSAYAILQGHEGDNVDRTVLRLLPGTITLDENKQLVGDGEVINLFLLNQSIEELAITTGVYPIEEYSGEFSPGIAIAGQDGPIGCAKLHMFAGEIITFELIDDGYVEVQRDGDTYNIDVEIIINGHSETINYSGNIRFIDDKPDESEAYKFEGTTVSTETQIYTNVATVKQTIKDDVQPVKLTLTNDSLMAEIVLYTDIDATTLNGVYSISSSGAVGTALKSSGSDNSGSTLYPSYVCTVFDKQGSYGMPIWYLVEGTITVTDGEISLSATSYFGSTINATYIGVVTL